MVITMTPSEAFESRLSRRDTSTVVSKLLLASSITATPSVILSLIPQTLGVRHASFSALFARYKLNFVRFKFFLNSTTSSGNGALGVLDDASTAEGNAPTSASGVLELRCSASNFAQQTTPTEFVWRPKPSLWLFCQQGASGSDPRLTVSGLVYGATSGSGSTGIFNTEIDISVSYKDAVDVGAL